MKRRHSGVYEIVSTADEKVKAFIPTPLPPKPPIDWTPSLQIAFEQATTALGRLDGVASILPDSALFIYSYVRKEALLSSQIEGTQSSLEDLFSFEAGISRIDSFDDVKEVSNYVSAIEHGLKRINEGFPISLRLIKEIHERILKDGRGSSKLPGEFRKSQNWIGGTRPGNASFVPPPHSQVPECMGALEIFLHEKSVPTLVKAALSHVQFETIHPFLDGNGRAGRLLITLLLCADGVLREPLLYLSLYFKERRDDYYRLLQAVRLSGDWEEWILFFLNGVHETATGAANTARSLLSLFLQDRIRLEQLGRSAHGALQVHAALQRSPISSVKEISARTKITPATVNKAIVTLISLGIVKEITGRQRGRMFVYDKFLSELSKGTGPIN